jgi:hypothetical protein
MKIEQKLWTVDNGWTNVTDNNLSNNTNLVLAFGGKLVLENGDRFKELQSFYPNSEIVMCSTAGEILDDKVSDGTINATVISFERTKIKTSLVRIKDQSESFDAGTKLLNDLDSEDLVYTLIISDGHVVNGSELTRALAKAKSETNIVTGGLAGDGPNFQSTLVGLNEQPGNGNIVGVGLYGKHLQIGHAAKGGWEPFGPERLVTKSKDNVLFELDELSALDLYKKYLGELADELPGSALLFPLSVKIDGSRPLVRTVLSVNEDDKSMTFAGDMPEGSIARMMKSNFERLIDGASLAAEHCISDFGSFEPELAILISCAGRKLALRDRVEEEVERVREVLGENTVMAGFYSYGEISPLLKSTKCELHNQTMTITTFKETV